MTGSENSSSGKTAEKQHAGPFTRAWFQLTLMEQKAVAVVLALALLGILVKCWHAMNRSDVPAPVQVEKSSGT